MVEDNDARRDEENCVGEPCSLEWKEIEDKSSDLAIDGDEHTTGLFIGDEDETRRRWKEEEAVTTLVVKTERVQKAIRGAWFFSITEKSKKPQRRRRKDSDREELQGLGRCSTKFFGSSDGDDLRGDKREVDRRKQQRPAIT
ncbi:hypothetical protein U1Q18_042123 [Sarracenia purpurea var. burkii]